MADSFTEDREGNALLEAATIELYRSNGFRVLGLPVTALPGEVHKRRDRLKKSLTFDPGNSSSTLLSIVPKPLSEHIDRAALRLLRDPISWLVDEVFWFWPSEHGEEDAGFRMLRDGDLKGALSYWSSLPQNSLDGAIGLHNSAVLNHLLALDIELVLNGTERVSWHQRLEGYWSEAYSNWCQIDDNELFWSRLSTRIRELGDQLGDTRLTTGSARRLRRNLPTAIIGIGARLAVRAARDGDLDEVNRHVSYLVESDFNPDLVEKVLEREAEPLIEQIKRFCEPVPAASKATPGHANKLARGLMADTGLRLASLDALIGDDHQIAAFTHDNVARALRSCVIDFGNETEEWKECCSLLEHARTLARDADLLERIGKDLGQAKENLSSQRRQETTQQSSQASRQQTTQRPSQENRQQTTQRPSQEHRQEAAQRQELKTAIASDSVYEVTVGGQRVSVPNFCTCCLGKPDLEQRPISWMESWRSQSYRPNLSFGFPLCSTCLSHQKEYTHARVGLVGLVTVISVLIGAVALSLVGTSGSVVLGDNGLPLAVQPASLGRGGIGPVLLLSSCLTTALTFVFGLGFRMRELSGDHACRARSVKMLRADGAHATFSFFHPLYANRFAESNGPRVFKGKATKPPQSGSIVVTKTLVSTLLPSLIVAGIGHAIAFTVIQNVPQQPSVQTAASSPKAPSKQPEQPKPGSSVPAKKAPQRTNPLDERRSASEEVVPRPSSPPVHATSGLLAKIDDGKARVATLEAEWKQMEPRLRAMKDKSDQYNRVIHDCNERGRLGLDVDEYRCSEAERNRNALRVDYDSLRFEYDSKYSEYKTAFESVRDMVRLYNAGER